MSRGEELTEAEKARVHELLAEEEREAGEEEAVEEEVWCYLSIYLSIYQ